MPEHRLHLRQATAGDVPALLSLMDSVLKWLVAQGRPEQWGTVPFSQQAGFPERVADWTSQGVITVAERGGACVGLLAAAPVVPPRVPDGVVPEGSMFIHSVMTDRGPDGCGVGSALLAHAEHLAKAQGAPALALDHWAGSPELGRIYDEHGYVRVAEYTDGQGESADRNLVRVRRLKGR
ncbi:GNAT family N-acetyltransferase [Actinomadura sp. KC06]|uniref:GNAT family N-acetyltransferase n=1 Tax=Actinomadura sp. KC06 TaxID=2530369 RepID=UPI00104D6F71|nr:GNAT family N-acetyltransferase [Actinomadura sp. KC06]TDD34478.1 GNAT family N-acetyltransferase [Actinomadura sp. KC06]